TSPTLYPSKCSLCRKCDQGEGDLARPAQTQKGSTQVRNPAGEWQLLWCPSAARLMVSNCLPCLILPQGIVSCSASSAPANNSATAGRAGIFSGRADSGCLASG